MGHLNMGYFKVSDDSLTNIKNIKTIMPININSQFIFILKNHHQWGNFIKNNLDQNIILFGRTVLLYEIQLMAENEFVAMSMRNGLLVVSFFSTHGQKYESYIMNHTVWLFRNPTKKEEWYHIVDQIAARSFANKRNSRAIKIKDHFNDWCKNFRLITFGQESHRK